MYQEEATEIKETNTEIEKECYVYTKKVLLEAKRKIESVPNWTNHIEKMRLVEGFENLLDYYRYITCNSGINYKDLELDDDTILKYDKYVIKKTRIKLREIAELAPYLYERYVRLIDLYKENNFCSFELIPNFEVSPDDMYNNLDEFINILGSDVAKLYNKIVLSDGLFLHNKIDYLGMSFNSTAIDNPRMILKSGEKNFDFYSTMIHELGHCYQFYLQRHQTSFEEFNPFLEATSIFFEELFYWFLKTKKKYQKMVSDSEVIKHIYFLNDISISKVLCSSMITNIIGKIDPFNLEYDPRVNKDLLREEVIKDCGYIMPNKINLDLTEFHYSIGNVMATYFLDKAKKDLDGTLKDYKDFICTVNNYPLKEILDKYFDTELVEKDIKTFIKSYRGR